MLSTEVKKKTDVRVNSPVSIDSCGQLRSIVTFHDDSAIVVYVCKPLLECILPCSIASKIVNDLITCDADIGEDLLHFSTVRQVNL